MTARLTGLARVGRTAPERSGGQVELPSRYLEPSRRISYRIALAFGLILFVAAVAYLGRKGYVDAAGGNVGVLDALYYATVSVTTTGYGDIRPESDTARLVNTVLVTPARVLFLILLVGTTLEVLAERTRNAYRVKGWRRSLRDHVIICGYGTKGRAAATTLLARGRAADEIVIVEERADPRERAKADGFATINGSAARSDVLHAAGVADAQSIVVACDRDDTAVLITLTARELAPRATVVSAVREEENAHLLRQSGADSVITSSGAAGRLLGLATQAPRLVEVLEDLLSVGEGLDVEERELDPSEIGPRAALRGSHPIMAVVRDDELLRFDDPRADTLRAGDRLVYLVSQSHENRADGLPGGM